jgi:predicted enzyme related to lactoylglutathione lyase
MTHHEHVATTDHIQYLSKDPAATRRFFEKVLGFHFNVMGEEMGNYAVRDDKMPQGAVTGVGGLMEGQLPSTIAFVTVKNLDESLKAAEAAGATLRTPKMEIPGVGWQAIVHAPGDLLVGLFQNKPAAPDVK